jgi:hypothetical protein
MERENGGRESYSRGVSGFNKNQFTAFGCYLAVGSSSVVPKTKHDPINPLGVSCTAGGPGVRGVGGCCT